MAVQTLEFKAEVKQILDLVINSLYSHKEVFLRELISNASDAIDKARYEALTNPAILEDDPNWFIRITPDKAAGTLKISDNGIGMTKEEIITALGTIAHSGTKEFLSALKDKNISDNPNLIGQFGVGFYSAFMVADRVTVITRKAGQKGGAVRWESTADGTFTLEDWDKPTKGTDVILHLKSEDMKYLEEWEIRNIVKKYSDFIEYPILMQVQRQKQSELEKDKTYTVTEDDTLNSQKALWLRDKSEITQDDYNEFYRHISHDFKDPLYVIHYKAEGTTEFTALLYIPAKADFNLFYKDFKFGPTLYVKRVQIMEHCEEMIPPYLRFIKGVVDSSDLPLNVSREILQRNTHVEVIKKSITKKVLDTLAELKKNNYDTYLKFYKEFGKVLKEGIHFDFSRRQTIADLLLFQSRLTGKDSYTTFKDYVDAMPSEQKEIYYITAATYDEAISSAYLEAFKAKGYDVLILTDEIDDFIMSGFEYNGKRLKSVSKGDIKIDEDAQRQKEQSAQKYAKLIDFIKERLSDNVKDVRLSSRLKDSVCCLVADEGDLDPQMQKILKSLGQEVPEAKRTLELNPEHPLLEALNALYEKDRQSTLLNDYVQMLYEQALILEGSKPKDAVAFAKKISELMLKGL